MNAGTEYRVRWRRVASTSASVKVFQTENGARRFMGRLLDNEADFGPIMELRLQQRDVGQWVSLDRAVRGGLYT